MTYSRTLMLCMVMSGLSSLGLTKGPAWNGLAGIAVHPEDNKIVTGGDNRVLYQLNQQTLEVTDRHYYGVKIGPMAFSSDGSTLIVEDEEDKISILDSTTFEPIKVIEKVRGLSVAMDSNEGLAFFNDWSEPKLLVFDLSSGEIIEEVMIENNKQLSGHAISRDGRKIAYMCNGFDSENEKKVPSSEVPRNLSSTERSFFLQKNDGRESNFFVMTRGKEYTAEEHKVFLTADSRNLTIGVSPEGSSVLLTYSDVNMFIDPQGEKADFPMGTFGYGRAVSRHSTDQFIIGGLRDFYLVDQDITNVQHGKLSSIDGWPEYFETFTAGPNKDWYGVTSAYRIHHILPDGTVRLSKPVY